MTAVAPAVVRLARADEGLAHLQAIVATGDRLLVESGMLGIEGWLPSPLAELVQARDPGEGLVAARVVMSRRFRRPEP